MKGSQATGATEQIGRLTNLMQLTVDTSWWTRYRDAATIIPISTGSASFPRRSRSLFTGQFPAIPRTDADLSPDDHIQAIANTAAFHFAFIEQGGTSLYPTLAQRVTHPEVLRILLSIGPTETTHFQTWQDKAGNAVTSAPLTDPTNGTDVSEPQCASLRRRGGLFQTNLIMPEPCPFLSRKFPVCSIIRPVATSPAIFGAVAAATGLAKSGLFAGQSEAFVSAVMALANAADAATRQC